MPAPYVPSPAWRASLDDGVLVVSAGADLVYASDELDEPGAQELLTGWEHGRFEPQALSARARQMLDELAAAGAVRPVDEPAGVVRRVGLRFSGRVDARLERRLGADLAESVALDEVADDPDVVLHVRTGGRLVDLYEAGPDAVPHLLLDVAYHHTVSLGPLVVPGETACLGCLAGRIGALWGDPPPPARPGVLDSPALAVALAVRELEAIAAGDFRLANTTVAYDTAAHRVSSCTVYRLPWCPTCGDAAEAQSGRIDLPWASAA